MKNENESLEVSLVFQFFFYKSNIWNKNAIHKFGNNIEINVFVGFQKYDGMKNS